MKKSLLFLCASSITFASFFSGCTSKKPSYMPSKDEYPGYTLIDSVDKDTTAAEVEKDGKVAIVFRDISTTSYSFLEPHYSNSMVHYDGKSNCCAPQNGLVGNSGMIVYKFSFIGKGNTTINLVARQKGLSATANSFDTDHVYTTTVHVK